MIIVNPYFLDSLIGPFAGLADNDEAYKYYSELDIKTENQFRNEIRKEIVKHYNNFSDKKKIKVKNSLKYYLSKEEYNNWEDIFDSSLTPFDPPKNARDFFVWIWEELFNKEDYHISDMKQYQVVVDIHEPNLP